MPETFSAACYKIIDKNCGGLGVEVDLGREYFSQACAEGKR